MRLLSSQPVDFSDGDTFKRVTVTHSDIGAAAEPFCHVRRPPLADVDDPGWSYVANVVSVAAGSFDVNVAAIVLGEPPIHNEGPTETVTLVSFLA